MKLLTETEHEPKVQKLAGSGVHAAGDDHPVAAIYVLVCVRCKVASCRRHACRCRACARLGVERQELGLDLVRLGRGWKQQPDGDHAMAVPRARGGEVAQRQCAHQGPEKSRSGRGGRRR